MTTLKINSKVVTTFWSAILQWSRVGMNAAVFLVLSRWLSLAEIGVVAAVQAPVIIVQSFVTTMIPDFVVQEKRPSQASLSTTFWLSLMLGVACSAILVASSHWVTSPLADVNARTYFLVLSASPLIWSLGCVFEGIQRKALKTKVLAFRTTVSSLVAGSVAIFLGYNGFSAWSLVCFTVTNACLATAILIISTDWRPTAKFRWRWLKARTGTLLALSGRHILGAASLPLIQYATALQLGTASSGALQIALRIFSLIDTLILAPYRFVVMPIFAQTKRTGAQLSSAVVRAVSFASILAIPAQAGMIITAPILVPMIIGSANGQSAVLPLQFLCLYGLMAAPVNVVNQVLMAHGHAVQIFRRSVLMYGISVVPSMVAAGHSVETVALVYGICGGAGGLVVTLGFMQRFLGISSKPVVSAWARLMLAGGVMLLGLLIYRLPLQLPPLSLLLLTSGSGVILFALGCAIFARTQIKDFLKSVMPQRMRAS